MDIITYTPTPKNQSAYLQAYNLLMKKQYETSSMVGIVKTDRVNIKDIGDFTKEELMSMELKITNGFEIPKDYLDFLVQKVNDEQTTIKRRKLGQNS